MPTASLIMLQYIRLIMPTQYLPLGRNASEIAVRRGDRQSATAACVPATRCRPVRVLAAELGLSPATVAAAYRDLRLKGIARGHRRAGTRDHRFAAHRAPASARGARGRAQPAQRVTGPAAAAAAAGAAPRSAGATISPRLYGDSPVSPRLAGAGERPARGRRHRPGLPGCRQRRAGRRRADPGCLAAPRRPGRGRGSRLPAAV